MSSLCLMLIKSSWLNSDSELALWQACSILCSSHSFIPSLPYTFLSSTYLPRHLSLSAPTLFLSLASSLEPTLVSFILDISSFWQPKLHPWSAVYFYFQWCWVANSLLGVSFLRLFPFSRICTERRNFIDNNIRWSKQEFIIKNR